MRRMLLALFLPLVSIAAAPAQAQGPMLDAVPANTCPGALPLRLLWIANGIQTDFGGVVCPGAGSGCVETMIVCHYTKAGGSPPADIFVQLYGPGGGAAIKTGSSCGVAAGASAAFVTLPLLPPYTGIPVGVGPATVPPTSLRVLATNPRVACDVTVFDTLSPSIAFSPGPAWAKDVTVTKALAPQKGD